MSPAAAARRGRARRLRALVVKETIQVFRDPSSILIAFVLPLILLFLFGYGVSLDANRVAIGLVLEDRSPEAQELAAGFTHSRFFRTTVVRDRRLVEEALVALWPRCRPCSLPATCGACCGRRWG